MKRRLPEPESLIRELAVIAHMDREALLRTWQKLYRTTPPAKMSRQLLRRAIAYRLQEQALGGLRPSTRRLLMAAVKQGGEIKPATPTLSPGTRLIREWQGNTHEVLVLEQGFMFRGKQYGSLSEVAGAITGAHWSGPKFFGLKRKVMQS